MKSKSLQVLFVFLTLLALTFGAVGVTPASADSVGGNVFLKGTYVELGIRPNGSFGSNVPAPAGYHPNVSGGLGFVSDYQKDGWDVGTPPYGGDFFMPGNPWEGFGVTCNGMAAENGGDEYNYGYYQIPAVSLTETSITSADWVGIVDICGTTLKITHHVHFGAAHTYVFIDTTIENIGANPATALTFGRGVDPDQEYPWTSNFTTTNQVLYQPGVAGNTDKAIVQATPLAYPDMKLVLGTVDPRARATAELPYFGMQNIQTLTSPVMGPITSDVALQIAYDLGTLAPAAQTTMTYFYMYDVADLILATTPYTVSGTLGAAGAGGTVNYGSGSTIADAVTGNYSFTVLGGWTGTITPSKADTYFTPASINVTTPVTADLPNQNFTTTLRTFGKLNPVVDAKDVGSNVVLRWGFSSGASGYEYCLTTTGPACDTGWQSAGAGPTFTVVGLANAQIYYWQIRSLYPGGATEADGGTWWSFTTTPGYFVKKEVANGTPDASLTPTLTWGGSNGATQYEYCITITPQTIGTICPEPGGWQSVGPALSVTPSLSGKQTYYWQVRAMFNGSYRYANNNAWWSFTTNASGAPDPFKKISPDDGLPSGTITPTLTWNTSSTATSYEYCLTTTGPACDTGWVNVGNVTSKTLNLAGAKTYYWQVQAVNGAGPVPADGGSWWSFTTPAGAFSKISPTDGLKDMPVNLVLRWNLSSGATSYEYCLTTTGPACDTGWKPAGTGPTFTVVGLLNARIYYWQLRSVYAGGETYADGGTWWSFTTIPGYFTKGGVTNGAAGVSLTPTLKWSGSNGAAQYEYCLTTTPQTTGTFCPGGWVVLSPLTATSVTPSLSPTTTYYWQVRSMYNGSYRYATNFAWWSFTTGP